MLRHALGASKALVSDCTTAVNPLFPQPQLAGAAARLGWGVVFKEYGAGREADSEVLCAGASHLRSRRRALADAFVPAGYGGGTIAQWFANANIDAIDVGIGILSMHSPMDVSAKVDLWELYRAFVAFLGEPASSSATAAQTAAPTAGRAQPR